MADYTPDEKDLLILSGIAKHKSMAEMAESCLAGVSFVQYRIQRLTDSNFIEAPKTDKKVARMRKLSQKGVDLLKQYKIIVSS